MIIMTNRKTFIKLLFTAIEGKDYILLKSIEKNIFKIDGSSDLDIWWPNKNDDFLEGFATNHSLVQKVTNHQQSFMNQLFIFFKDGGFLQIDCIYQLIRKDLIYLSNDYLKTQQRTKHGIKIYTDFCLFEHIVLFNQLNYAGMPEKYIAYFEALPPVVLNSILIQFNKKYQTAIVDLSWLASFKPDLHKKLQRYLHQLKENRFLSKQTAKIKYWIDSLKNLKKQRGFLISFSGVDGAGKSTILAETRQLLSQKFRKKTVVIRHRPSILPILSSFIYGKKQAENRSANRLPRTGKNTSKLNSLLRFSYYFTDYLFGRSYIFFKYQLRNYIVLYDRYYFDFIIDPKRTNLKLDKSLTKMLYRFIQKPKINFFLHAPAEIILERKKELPPEAIKTLTIGYQNLFSQLKKEYSQEYFSIENIEKDKTINFISTQLVQAF
jgi:Thymidylate kinase